MKEKIGFIGCGNMAQAIIGGILNKNIISEINVYDIDKNKYLIFDSEKIIPKESVGDTVLCSDYIFLAVKPQHIKNVFEEITVNLENKIVISILAGVTTDFIRKLAQNENLKVIRVMPNTPLLVGEGATALCKTENVSDVEYNFVKNIFSASGLTADIKEGQMNQIININGSTPAYIFLFTMAVEKYAEISGIDKETALNLFCQTLKGSAQMMLSSGKSPEELKVMVTSPGGTTQAALKIFEEAGFVDIIIKAMNACEARAEELGK